MCSNRKQQSAITKSHDIIGYSTVSSVTQFDLKIETGITCLSDRMKIIGRAALRAFLEINSKVPEHD